MSKYQIYVGRKRENNALIGSLVKGRNDIIKGETTPASVRVGKYGVPNFTQIWGRRLVNGNIPKEEVSAENPLYSGEVEPMKWGARGGTMIPVHWEKGYSTIDWTYQKLRLKLELNDEHIESSLILLDHGFNEFDEVDDKAFVQMLKVHGMNENSIYKNPNYHSVASYKEISQEIEEKEDTIIIDSKFECLLLINEASKNNDSVKVLFNIVSGIEFKDVNADDVTEVFTALKIFADKTPNLFASRVNSYKLNASAVLEKAKIFKLLDTTKDGTIVVSNSKGEDKQMIDGVEGKGEKMIENLFSNLLDKSSFEFIEKIKIITDKLK
jgi:hypothetical protein